MLLVILSEQEDVMQCMQQTTTAKQKFCPVSQCTRRTQYLQVCQITVGAFSLVKNM